MPISLEEISYVPTLAIRPSEMNGLENLSGLTKSRLCPVFLLAPWPNANNLVQAIERAEKAFPPPDRIEDVGPVPSRHYILDIDRDYPMPSEARRPAQREFFSILDGEKNRFSAWWEFVESHRRIQPCVQLGNQNRENIIWQVEQSIRYDRTPCLRVRKEDRYSTNLKDIASAFNDASGGNFIVILEGGWTENALSLMAWFSGMVQTTLSEVDGHIPIVLSCTSIPQQFGKFAGCEKQIFTNRDLLRQTRSQTNRPLIYGDWGSTRPRDKAKNGRRPFDRIDYPLPESWVVSRNAEKRWTFQDAARELISRTDIWEEDLLLWGTHMIRQTCDNPAFGINTPQKNVAARINIHLYRQAHYGGLPVPESDHDDNYTEDI